MKLTILAAGLGLLATPLSAQVGNPGGPINDRLGDADYGVCRGTDARCFHAWPRSDSKPYRILVYTRTAGPRHAALGKPLPPGMDPPLAADNVVQREMVRIAHENGWDIDYTEDPAQMTNLMGYHAVVFVSTSRDNLDDNGKTALRQYMRAGGGFVGIHNAFGTLYNWPYYEGLLGGANFYDHGPEREGDVVLQANDPSLGGVAKRFRFTDEWYNLIPFPTRVKFLATVDEKSWGPPVPQPARPPAGAMPPGFPPRLPSVVGKNPGHGDFHPVTWCQYYDGGKAWLTTLGHDARAYQKDGGVPGAAAFQAMIVGGIKSVMGAQPFCTVAAARRAR